MTVTPSPSPSRSFGHASNGHDFDTDLSRNVNQIPICDDYSLWQLEVRSSTVSTSLATVTHGLAESSQLLAAQRRGPLRCWWLALLLRFEYSSVDGLKHDDTSEVAYWYLPPGVLVWLSWSRIITCTN